MAGQAGRQASSSPNKVAAAVKATSEVSVLSPNQEQQFEEEWHYACYTKCTSKMIMRPEYGYAAGRAACCCYDDGMERDQRKRQKEKEFMDLVFVV